MKVEECYANMKADYAGAIRVFQNDERIMKYFRIMQKDTSFDDIGKALEKGDYEVAFRGAHTLKGVAMNMHFTALAKDADELTEALRSREANTNIIHLMEKTEKTYQITMDCIDACLKSTEEGN